MASHHPIRKQVTAPAPVIPDKLYFRIGDVARLCEVPAYVLRFWETEFPQLKPNKGGTGQRLYRRKDVEIALRIKSLLYDQGYTIPGARQVFKSEASTAAEPQPEPSPLAPQPMAVVPQPASTPAVAPHQLQGLHALREELHKLAAQLAQPIGNAPSAPALTVVPTPAKPKPLRPRLVLEPKAAESKAAPTMPMPLPTIDPRQRDLFAAE
jgi:DNA-binding transcriptional MerR regulator